MTQTKMVGAWEWQADGRKILDAANLSAVHKHCDTEGAVAVLHLHFCGGQGPTALVFEDADAFGEYVKTCAKAGDLFEVRPFPYSGSMLATGKVADTEGYTPVGGAY